MTNEELAQKFAEMSAKVEAQTALISEQSEQLAAQEAKITEMNTSVKTVTKAANKPVKRTIPETEFKAANKKYKFRVAAFILANKVMTAKEALTDQTLLNRIVKDYPGLVQAV